MQRVAIITGITGQDGAYLAKLLLDNDYRVVGLTRSIHSYYDFGLNYLGIKNLIELQECSLLDFSSIISVIKKYKPDEIYNLAAQSSVGQSFLEPITTIQFNTQSVLNLLEAIRITGFDIKFYQASSSEMYGQVENLPITEESQMRPMSPYAISKASAYWIVNEYKDSYGIFACSGILFNHESFLRRDNFFIKKVISKSLLVKHGKIANFELGNLDVWRDFGYAPEYVKAMNKILCQDIPNNYIICSGTSLRLRDIVSYVLNKLNLDVSTIVETQFLERPNEILNIYGDNTKAKMELDWNYNTSFYDIIDVLIEEERRFLIKDNII